MTSSLRIGSEFKKCGLEMNIGDPLAQVLRLYKPFGGQLNKVSVVERLHYVTSTDLLSQKHRFSSKE